MEAYKVGVTFALNNLVSAELLKITAQLNKANEAATRLGTSIKSLSGVTAGIAQSAHQLGDSFKYAATQVDGVHAKINRLNSQSGAGSSGSGGTGWMGAAAAGVAARYGPLAAGYAGYKSISGGMKIEDTVARAMIAAGLPVGSGYMNTSFAQSLRQSIFSTSTSYGVDLDDTQEAALQAMRALAPMPADQRAKLLPSLTNFAGTEVLGKHGTSMHEATEAGIALAHQLRAYAPGDIEKHLNAFAKLSMASPASLTQLARMSSYYLPLLNSGLHMDPDQLMALGVAGSQLGLGTKSGTWLADLYMSPFTADLTGKRDKARKEALERLGIVADGQVVTKNPIDFLAVLGTHMAAMSDSDRGRYLSAAFGKQGARAGTLFSDPAALANIVALSQGLKTAQSPDALQKQYGQSPLVQFNQSKEAFMTTLTKLGESIMPAVTSSLQVFTGGLQLLNTIMDMSLAAKLGKRFGAKVRAGTSAAAAAPGFIQFIEQSLANGTDILPPGGGQTIVLHHSTNLDGSPLARTVTEYVVKGLYKAPASGNDFDPRMTPTMPGSAIGSH